MLLENRFTLTCRSNDFLWHSESSSAVTLLLHADWIMLKNSSNQGGANSMTLAPWHMKSGGGCWSPRKPYFSKIIWQLALGFYWMPQEEVSTFQFSWCLIWKPGESNFWVKICLAGSKFTRLSHPPTLLQLYSCLLCHEICNRISRIIEWTFFLESRQVSSIVIVFLIKT